MSANPIAGHYTSAQIDYLAQYLQKQISAAGLGTIPIDTASAWIRSEQGANGNVLGVTSSGHLNTYSSPEAGIQGAVQLLQMNSAYSGILSSIKSGQDASQVAYQIVKSPWSGTFGKSGYSINPTTPITTLATQDATNKGILLGLGAALGGTAPGSAVTGAANAVTGTQGAAAGVASGILSSIPNAIGFIGVLLVGLVFIVGAFLLSGHNKSQVVVV